MTVISCTKMYLVLLVGVFMKIYLVLLVGVFMPCLKKFKGESHYINFNIGECTGNSVLFIKAF